MGNICRSPSAEGVFRRLVRETGLEDRFEIDSAGTHADHIGQPPDVRSQAAARARGIELGALRARAVTSADYERFDWIIAMDHANLAALERDRPQRGGARLGLLLEYALDGAVDEVPAPYYGAADGFEQVLDLLERGAAGLLAHIRERQGL